MLSINKLHRYVINLIFQDLYLIFDVLLEHFFKKSNISTLLNVRKLSYKPLQ